MNLIEKDFPRIDRECIEEPPKDIYLVYKLVALLLEKTTLTHQEIADILKVSESKVEYIYQRNRERIEGDKYLH